MKKRPISCSSNSLVCSPGEPVGMISRIEDRTNTEISNILVSCDMTLNELKHLNVSRTCGPDDIHPRLLIELVEHIKDPIALLINISYLEDNYRSISLTPIVLHKTYC